MKENFTSFCLLGVFKNSLMCLWFKSMSSCKSDF